MEFRKRPRVEADDHPQSLAAITSSSSSSPTVKLLETQLLTLRHELTHSQSIRAIERKNATRSEARLKRQLTDAFEEITQNGELIESLREQVDFHGQKMEESASEWMERIRWYEERWEESANNQEHDQNCDDGGKSELLQQRLDAAMNQVRELEHNLEECEERATASEERAANAEQNAAESKRTSASLIMADEHKPEIIPRELRIKLAETERANRDLQRQNDTLNGRVRDMIQHKERAASSQRRVAQLEEEVQHLTRESEGGREAQKRWTEFRNEIMEEGLVVGEDDDGEIMKAEVNENDGGSAVPPEIATVVRKFQAFKQDAKQREDEIARVTQMSEAHLRKCKVLETQLNEQSQSLSQMEKTVEDLESSNNHLDMENRKIMAQQKIWKRESDGMRSLLDTYEQQETSVSKSPARSGRGSGNADGLQLGLDAAREEVKLLSETNEKLEASIEELRTEQQTAKEEHERVKDKFGMIRAALMEERSKAEAAEARAIHAETLAGKGSYNEETTRVLHLKSNPFADAIREKHRMEIESLQRRLEEAEAAVAQGGGGSGTTTPASSKDRRSFGSAGSRDSTSAAAVDAQKLHSRLKEQFRNQIALFRQGVYLITGFKIDMSQSSGGGGGDNDCQLFTVRSVYGEREDDHLVFKWNPKKKNKLDMLNTDMAHLLMQGPNGVYVKEHGSWPGFMASVTLQLFDQQTC